jgi:hypothetical protein
LRLPSLGGVNRTFLLCAKGHDHFAATKKTIGLILEMGLDRIRVNQTMAIEVTHGAASQRSVKIRARGLLTDCISVVLALFLIELPALTGAVDYQSLIGTSEGEGVDVVDLELIHRHMPHLHAIGASKGGNIAQWYKIPDADLTINRWDARYDQNGFRNERDLTNADLAVIGDSFVESMSRPTPQLLTTILGSLQNKMVANLGQYGYTPPEELGTLKRYALPLRPQTVIWMFFEWNYAKSVVRHRNRVNALITHQLTAKPERVTFWARIWHRTFLRNARLQLRALQRAPSKSPPFFGTVKLANGQETNMYFGYKAAPLSESDLSDLNDAVQMLQEASRLCSAQGARFVVVLIPEKFRIFQPVCRFPKGSECLHWTVSDLPAWLRQKVQSVAPEAGFLDLTPFFADAATKGILPFERDDSHWSAEGESIAAHAINAYLLNWTQP